MSYQITWHCFDCKTNEVHVASKIQAAFWECHHPLRCKQCKSRSGSLTTTPEIVVDHEILTHWANNNGVYFWPQDDEIFLSMQPLHVLLDFIQNHFPDKRGAHQLIEAIPIKLYDEEFENADERRKCVAWVKNNRELWEPLSMNYIKEGILPKIT